MACGRTLEKMPLIFLNCFFTVFPSLLYKTTPSPATIFVEKKRGGGRMIVALNENGQWLTHSYCKLSVLATLLLVLALILKFGLHYFSSLKEAL